MQACWVKSNIGFESGQAKQLVDPILTKGVDLSHTVTDPCCDRLIYRF